MTDDSYDIVTRCNGCDRTIAMVTPIGKTKVRVVCTRCREEFDYEVALPDDNVCEDCGESQPVRFYWFRGELFRICEECESNHRQLE